MSSALAILVAIVAGLVLVFGLLRVSIWLTDRKSSDELVARNPDGSLVNHDSSNGMWDGHADGGGD